MMDPFNKILVMTDLHLRGAGKSIIGLDPVARFATVLDAALADHADADALILLGDLTHSGRAEEYSILRDILAACPVPVIPLLGNHDHRDTFLKVFPNAGKTPSGYVQNVLDLAYHRIITLDSYAPDARPIHSGFLCDDRLAWLDDALASAGPRIPLVFMHHPPFDVGLPGMDPIKLVNGQDVLSHLANTGAHLFCGHIHRTISGQIAGVPFTIFKSPCHQAPLDLSTADSTLSVDEPGAYGLLPLTTNGVVVHHADVGGTAAPIASPDANPDTAPEA